MKGLGPVLPSLAAAAWFATSAVAQLDPIVIKVRTLRRLISLFLVADHLFNCSGLQILLQDKRH